MNEAPIIAVAEVARVLKPDLFELRLPNGKPTLGHFSKELRTEQPVLKAGDRVQVELTPFDFDAARISSVEPA